MAFDDATPHIMSETGLPARPRHERKANGEKASRTSANAVARASVGEAPQRPARAPLRRRGATRAGARRRPSRSRSARPTPARGRRFRGGRAAARPIGHARRARRRCPTSNALSRNLARLIERRRQGARPPISGRSKAAIFGHARRRLRPHGGDARPGRRILPLRRPAGARRPGRAVAPVSRFVGVDPAPAAGRGAPRRAPRPTRATSASTDPESRDNPYFDFLKQAYVLTTRWAKDLVARADELDPKRVTRRNSICAR